MTLAALMEKLGKPQEADPHFPPQRGNSPLAAASNPIVSP